MSNITEYVLCGLLYVVGVILTVAAFAKVHSTSNTRLSEEDKFGIVLGSFLPIWPISLLGCVCVLVYRRVYEK